jgi:uncharacterized PurR-regulated membrane protein YhhQ (DUF165 family)
MFKFLLIAAFAATVPAANWMIGNVGQCIPNGPCLIPVGFGLMAPSGVLMVGAALALRDAVHSILGAKFALIAIALGVILSAAVAPASLVIASAAAFLMSELSDFAVYAPLRQKSVPAAIIASGLVGSVVDSAAFLLIAFGSLDFIAGQVVGKMEMTLVCAVAALMLRRTFSAPQKQVRSAEK